MITTRREFLQETSSAALAMMLLSNEIFAADAAGGIALPELGRLEPLPSKAIQASPLSVGFETLDRFQFDPSRTYEHLGKLGVKWARAQTGWCRCEREKGKFDFRWLDDVVDALRNQGIQVWFNLSYGNKLYSPEAPDVSAVGFVPLYTEEARAGWTAFVRAIAKHFADRVKYSEIWNEPNHPGFFRPKKPTPEGYVELVKFAAPLIRSQISDAKIIGGSVAGGDPMFIEGCLKAGLADYIDRLSFHSPYGMSHPEADEKRAETIRKLLGKRSATIKLWQGESGCPSNANSENGSKNGKKWTELSQAKYLLRFILGGLRQDLELTSYFTAVDFSHYNWGQGPSNDTQSYGVLRGSDYSPKPSFYAFQSLCSLFDAQTKHDPLLEVVPAGVTDKQFTSAGFVRNARGLYAYWMPSDLLDDFVPRTISLRLPIPAGATIENPVLIDPLSQRVHDLKAVASKTDGLSLAGLPLFDYPLIVTDRTVVSMHTNT